MIATKLAVHADGKNTRRTRAWPLRLLLVVVVGLLFLTACAPPDPAPIVGVTCDWINAVKAVGLAIGTIVMFISFMIIVVSYAGAGIVWHGLYQLSQQLVNGAVVAILLLLFGLPAFWWFMGQVGGTVCS